MNKKQKRIFAINLLLMCASFMGNYLYMTIGGIEIKSFASGMFALMGIINLCYTLKSDTEHKKFCISMAVGLIFAMFGDIGLNFDFILGAALFAIGHIWYFIAYCMYERIQKLDLIISAVFFAGAGSYILFCPLLKFPEAIMKYVCLVYGLIISVMVGKAIGNFIRNKNLVTAILITGSLLFLFSDLMLVFNWFMDVGDIAANLCMATYYPAECLLALSVFATDILKNYKRK